MSKAFDSIKKGLEEAVAYSRGNEGGVRIHRPPKPDIRAIRDKMGISEGAAHR